MRKIGGIRKKALTILEMVVVVTIFMALIGVVVPPVVRGLVGNQIEVAGQELLHVLRNAQNQSTVQFYDTSWGVSFDTVEDTYTLYAAVDSTHDIEYVLPATVTLGTVSLNGGGTSVVFDQLTGETGEYGTVELVGKEETRTITINQLGNVRSD